MEYCHCKEICHLTSKTTYSLTPKTVSECLASFQKAKNPERKIVLGGRTRYRMGGQLTVTSHELDNFSEGKTLMRGYNAMLEKVEPSKIICFGTPFSEMDGNIITVDYAESGKAVG